MKKFFAILLSAMLMLSLAVPAMAVTTGTVKNDTNRTYNAYQIFSGTQAEDSAVLGDIEWGTGIDDEAFLTELKKIDAYKDCDTAADVAAALEGVQDESDTAKAFANLAAKHLTDTAAVVEANNNATLDSGYYLLVDTSSDNAAQNPALLQVTNDTGINIKDKSGAPSVDKTIKDEDEAAEGSIGDTFTFELTATMPTTFEGYDSYKVVFHDTMSKGLTYVENSITVPTGFTASVVKNDNGITTITVTNDNVLDDGVTAGATLTVTYQATLNSEAVVGAAGNPNEVYLEYSNDPNWNGTPEQEPTKVTPEDKVVVFTFELDVTKIDGATAGKDNPTKLQGAEFVLLNSDKTKVATVVDGKLTGWVDVPPAVEGVITWPKNTTLTSDANGLFVIKGLDQGTFFLKETKAPAGYNLLKDAITVVITATVTDNEDAQELTALTIKVGDSTTDGILSSGIVGTTVENNAGATLPETGGMGTTIFYIVGGVMVAAAVVLLITKKRMSAEG